MLTKSLSLSIAHDMPPPGDCLCTRTDNAAMHDAKKTQIQWWFGMKENFPVDRLYTRKAGSKVISYVAPATKRYLLDDPAGSRLQVCTYATHKPLVRLSPPVSNQVLRSPMR